MDKPGSVFSIMSHEVEDFDTWKKGFDGDEGRRAAVGMKAHGVYQAHDNPNHVTVHMEAPSAEMLQGFAADPNFHEAMRKAGVKGQPEMKILRRHS